MKIALWSTDNNAEFMPLLLYTLDKANMPYEISENQKWVEGKAWEVRMAWYHTWLIQQHPHETVLLLDPWDHVYLGSSLQEFYDKLSAFGSPIIWAGEKHCWPNPERTSSFPSHGTPYRFPNGGAIVGPAASLANHFDPERISGFAQANYDPTGVYHPDGNQPWLDQVFFQDLYLNGVGQIDNKCSLFQTLVDHNETDFVREGDKIKNVVTGECPLFFHANGRARFPKCLMDLLEETL